MKHQQESLIIILVTIIAYTITKYCDIEQYFDFTRQLITYTLQSNENYFYTLRGPFYKNKL